MMNPQDRKVAPILVLRHISDGRWLKDVRADGSEVRARNQSDALVFHSEASAKHILGSLNHPLSDRPQGIRYEIVAI